MSGHVRFGFAAFLVVAGTTPAASNALTDLFSPGPAPEAATPAPAPAQDECLRQPGPATAGGHWVYRYDGRRKCWFQAEGGPAVAKKPSRSHASPRRVTAPERSESAPPRQQAAEDARAEVANTAPAQTGEPPPSTPKLTMVRTIPVRMTDAAGLVPPAPVRARPGADQLTPDQSTPGRVDVEQLLADAPAASEALASATAATPIAAAAANTPRGEQGIPAWPGVLLMALGGAALFASSPALRRALWRRQIPDEETELPATARRGRRDPSFASPGIRFAGAGPGEVLEVETQSLAPLVHAASTRRTAAPPPSREALWEEGIGALASLASPVSPEVFSRRRAMPYRGVEQRG